jgi:aspartate aminotransferase-like enzyme
MLGTTQDVLLAGGNGTQAMELTVANLVNAGDRVLVVSQGEFGNRFAEILKCYRADVHVLSILVGPPVSDEIVESMLRKVGPVDACFLVHVETSVGIRCDLEILAATIRRQCPKSLIVVDAMTSLGAHEIQFDAWGLDAIVSSGHKAIGGPMGIGFIGLSDRAWRRCARVTNPRFTGDLNRMRESHRRGQSRHVLPMQPFFGVDEALRMISEIGLTAFRAHLDDLASYTRTRLQELGLELTAASPLLARSVTCAWLPPHVSAIALVQKLIREFGIEIATGRGPWQDRMVRIGHLGLGSSRTDLEIVTSSLAECLSTFRGAVCVA